MRGAVRGGELRGRMARTMAETVKINGTELAYLEHGQGPGGLRPRRRRRLPGVGTPGAGLRSQFRTITLSCRSA